MVIFGNGYASANEHAVLFVLDAITGAKIAQIDTGVGSCNGLSTPIPVDVDLDYKMDYVYAGDLKGNVWKFDLTGTAQPIGASPMATAGPPSLCSRQGMREARRSPSPPSPKSCISAEPICRAIWSSSVQANTSADSDFADTQTQTIYGLWDYGDDADDTEYLGSFNRGSTPQLSNQPAMVTLLQQVEVLLRHNRATAIIPCGS